MSPRAHAETDASAEGEGAGEAAALEGEPACAQAEEVVGQCLSCSTPWDVFEPTVVCTVCRALTLVCEGCRGGLHGEYHCWKHREWKDCYFTVLDRFSETELRAQLCELEQREEAMQGDRGLRNPRRTLRRQRAEVEARIEGLVQAGAGAGVGAGAGAASTPPEPPVASAGGAAVEADGVTNPQSRAGDWGFWAEREEAAAAAEAEAQQ